MKECPNCKVLAGDKLDACTNCNYKFGKANKKCLHCKIIVSEDEEICHGCGSKMK